MILQNRTLFRYLLLPLLIFTILQLCNAEIGNIPDTHEENPSWSPDGQKILFISWGPMNDGVFLIKPNGSELQKIGGGMGSFMVS